MRQTTAVGICWQQSREEGGEDVEWVCLCGRCVVPPIQEMRLAVAGLVECVCSVVLCVKCEMGCGLQVV